jgi:hypothetical protein
VREGRKAFRRLSCALNPQPGQLVAHQHALHQTSPRSADGPDGPGVQGAKASSQNNLGPFYSGFLPLPARAGAPGPGTQALDGGVSAAPGVPPS